MISNQSQQFFSDQQIKSFLENNNYQYLKQLDQGDYSIVVQAYSYQHQTNSLDGNQLYMSPEVINGEKPYSIKVDTFSVGIIILQALFGDSLKPLEIISLKLNLIENVIPNIKNHQNYNFIQHIVSQMVDYQQKNRLEPLKLIQNFKSFKIEQSCLKQLVLPQKLNYSTSLSQFSTTQHFFTNKIYQGISQSPQYLSSQEFFKKTSLSASNIGNILSASKSLFPLLDTLKNQSNLLELRLYLVDMGLKEDILIRISNTLTQLPLLKLFDLSFGKNNADYDSIIYLINTLAKSNTCLENLYLGLQEMNTPIFQNIEMIRSIFNQLNSLKKLTCNNVQYQLQVDTFSVGIIILQALLGDSLKPMQILKLKSYLIENVIPNLKNQPNYDFIQNIVSQMIHYEQQNRLEPLKLIQILKSYKIEQDCLNQLVFPQKLKQSASLQQQSVVQQSNSQQIDQQIAQLPQYLKIYAQDKDRSKLNVSVIQKIKLTDQQVNLKYEKQLSNNQ
ncbi:hypothetical protein ABPG74_019741 [Tetrahymena malaccensis]